MTPAASVPTTDPGAGLVTLDPPRALLLHKLDERFQQLALEVGAQPLVPPPLLPAEWLADLDYFKNFPHLCLTTGCFTDQAADSLAAGTPVGTLPAGSYDPTGYVLPSATCYGMLLSQRGRQLPEELRLTAVARCFRNENHFDGLRRLRGFHMREVIYLGHRDGAEQHLAVSREFVQRLAAGLGLELEIVTANDPFYDRDGSRAKLTALDPVKHEFVIPDGTAIASINRHRNFFGDRLDITWDGTSAYTSCTAFGVERWIHAMELQYGSAEKALERLDDDRL
ncbi:aminoacyl--tRNA ligase-related protein [Streptomyces sp. NPDC051677]|uniref:aminoacyl--tRNA ligase-related protein n=1 Tax=Streptomyces sp. NPDC051677 TaxID=3365669 RepID=UPI0037D106B0